MSTPPTPRRKAVLFNPTGWYSDGWCKPVVTFSIGAEAELSAVQLELWLKNETRSSSFAVQIGDLLPFVFSIPSDELVSVQVACVCEIGTAVQARITCANVVIDKGADERELSFRLNQVSFH